jgi:hypothetical protein
MARCGAIRWWWCAATLVASAVPVAAEQAPSFNRDIKSILSNRCLRCHGPDAAARQGGGAGGLRLDTFAGATADLGGHAALVPGDAAASELMRRITSQDPDTVMPPPEAGPPLKAAEVERLRRWIGAGATYEPHWAYLPPRRPAVPAVKQGDWPRNDIDRFVLARLESEGLVPQSEAERAVLARRLALDLTGLPPTPEQVDAFVADRSADAVEKLVDRLLAHQGYGEHQARQWLDLARYADSAGYADDRPRQIWGYRDWVIRACDENMPFDEFTVRQIAGDLLPGATEADRVATAFHRNTLTNSEGGTIDEEFRVAAVVDRVNTTLGTWMGTTIACAQCHDHKYDPLSQREYFGLYAIFNNTADADRSGEEPLLAARGPAAWELDGRIAEIEARLPAAAPGVVEPPEFGPARALLAELKRQRAAEKTATVPVMEELPAGKRRVTKIMQRGNWQALGEEVTEGLPGVFGVVPQAGDRVDRLVLARWLVDPRNPLTARVIVNRIWERLFGGGLVATSEEFGSQGDPPSHPQLLDWLAVELVERDWDLKAITRLIVMSAAYRQSSQAPSDLVARDPDNRLLARGPRVRLPAEVIRDQALAAAGLLSEKKFGPSVNPPQPNLGLNAAFGGNIDWQTSPGDDRHRRGIYTTWRRSNPYPSMATFDAPNREVCTVRRPRTNTPLQALVTLNDPVYVEAAQGLARRMVREGGLAVTDRAARGFRLLLARQPAPAELERLAALHDEVSADYQRDPAAAEALATEPRGPLPADLGGDVADLAAWTVVANVILNLDEAFMCP